VLSKTNTPGSARLSSANPPGGTNLAARRFRVNEAELVREHKAGLDRDLEAETPPPLEPAKPLVNDPVLARALDLVKGLALVRQNHF
jgi:hypothetical protein